MQNFLQNIKDEKIKFIDSHSHLHDKAFDLDRQEVVNEMNLDNIATLTIGTDLKESRNARDLAASYSNIFYTIGLHPYDNISEFYLALNDVEDYFQKLESLFEKEKCLAIGECGLDYFYIYRESENIKNLLDLKDQYIIENIKNKKDEQRKIFERHIDLAVKLDLPLMLHIRPSELGGDREDAYLDSIDILREYQDKHRVTLRGNFHFFVSTKKVLEKVLQDLPDFTISIPAVCTFTDEYDEMIKHCPIYKMHIETDSPYVLPKVKRPDVKTGKIKNRNQPNFVTDVFEKVCEIKNIETDLQKEDFRKQLLENFIKMYIKDKF